MGNGKNLEVNLAVHFLLKGFNFFYFPLSIVKETIVAKKFGGHGIGFRVIPLLC